ncbi:hypothetical protein F5Y03DRAFT_347202 [Xylaria venustula]|nr:hypothetical protein F5Y03DRAFT_347202 [Xylaria venustula]
MKLGKYWRLPSSLVFLAAIIPRAFNAPCATGGSVFRYCSGLSQYECTTALSRRQKFLVPIVRFLFQRLHKRMTEILCYRNCQV